MFGLGMPEILLILAIALMVIGPKKLPEVAKTLGRAMGEFKKAAQDFKRTLDVESSVGEYTNPITQVGDDLKDAVKSANPLSDDTDNKKTPGGSKDAESGSSEAGDSGDADAADDGKDASEKDDSGSFFENQTRSGDPDNGSGPEDAVGSKDGSLR